MTSTKRDLDHLDVKVARVLGWHSFRMETLPAQDGPTGVRVPERRFVIGASPGARPKSFMHPPHYSTSPPAHRFQEMIDHLSPADPGSSMGSVYLAQCWRSGPTRCTWRASIGEYAGAAAAKGREQKFWAAEGVTIFEAVAKLIVAVDKELEK